MHAEGNVSRWRDRRSFSLRANGVLETSSFFLISRSRRLEISEMSVERVYSAWKYSEDFFNAFTAPGNISKICLTRPEKLEIFLRFLLTRLQKLGMLKNFLAHLGHLEIFQRLVQRV